MATLRHFLELSSDECSLKLHKHIALLVLALEPDLSLTLRIFHLFPVSIIITENVYDSFSCSIKLRWDGQIELSVDKREQADGLLLWAQSNCLDIA